MRRVGAEKCPYLSAKKTPDEVSLKAIRNVGRSVPGHAQITLTVNSEQVSLERFKDFGQSVPGVFQRDTWDTCSRSFADARARTQGDQRGYPSQVSLVSLNGVNR